MDDKEFKKGVELLMSMSTSYLMGSMNRATFTSNLGMIAGQMGAKVPPKPCTCDRCLDVQGPCVEKNEEGPT